MSRRQVRLLEAQLADERSRVERLLELLMAKSAPAEFAAYVAPAAPAEDGEWLFDDTGLNSTWIPHKEL